MNFQAFLESLPIMGQGMLGIFAVILVIMLCTMGVNAVFSGKEDGKKKSEQEG